MFIVNQLLGTVLVHPDWDSQLQWVLRYLTLSVVVTFAVAYWADVADYVNQFTGIQNV